MVFRANYKGRPAVGIQSGSVEALFLPEDGGKLASLRDGDRYEYMDQAPGEVYLPLTRDGIYVDSECSGFDDMFPTIDPFDHLDVHYPDHGEVCRMPLSWQPAGEGARFWMSSPSLGYQFEKTAFPSGDGAIKIQYRIVNNGDAPLPSLWAAHCMLAWANGARPITAYSEGAPIRMMFGELGGAAYKYYYTQPNPGGWCGCAYPDRGKAFLMRYDAARVPYLGVWINNGGFQRRKCIALEPCTAPFDRPDPRSDRLMPGEPLDFSLTLSVKSMIEMPAFAGSEEMDK